MWSAHKENPQNERFRSSPAQVFKESTKLKVVLKLEQNTILVKMLHIFHKSAKSKDFG